MASASVDYAYLVRLTTLSIRPYASIDAILPFILSTSLPGFAILLFMASVLMTFTSAEKATLDERAQALGIAPTTYAKRLILDSLRRHPDAKHTQLLTAVRALVPILAEAVCQALPKERNIQRPQIDSLVKLLLERYDRS